MNCDGKKLSVQFMKISLILALFLCEAPKIMTKTLGKTEDLNSYIILVIFDEKK